MDVELARRLATRALALARARADVDGAAAVLQGLASDDREALALARSRCLAAADQSPDDDTPHRAVSFLDAAIDR